MHFCTSEVRGAKKLHFRCIILFRFFSVTSAVRSNGCKRTSIWLLSIDTSSFSSSSHASEVQIFASKGANFCKNMHLGGAKFYKKIAFEWSRLTATAIKPPFRTFVIFFRWIQQTMSMHFSWSRLSLGVERAHIHHSTRNLMLSEDLENAEPKDSELGQKTAST